MADWKLEPEIYRAQYYPTTEDLTTISSGTPGNTKGSYVELIASTPYAGYLHLHVYVYTTPDPILLDVSLGGEGSEVPIINNLVVDAPSAPYTGRSYVIPIYIPVGSRVSMRTQQPTTSVDTVVACGIIGIGGYRAEQYTKCVTYGADTSDSGGTQIDPGASVRTKGAWVELAASTTYPISGIFLGIGTQGNYARYNYRWNVDVGVGASGSEQIVIGDYRLYCSGGNDLVDPVFSPFFPIRIPLGSRIAVRASCLGNDATDRLFDAFIYALG